MKRSTLLVWHRRLALAFAPLLVLHALSGAALVFSGPLARTIDPSGMIRRTAGGDAPVSRLYAAAGAIEPGFRVIRLFMPADGRDVAFVHLSGADGTARYAALDPGSAEVLASGTIWRFPVEAALRLHYRLMDGRLGLAVVLAEGVVLAFLAVTGVLYWWPGRGGVLRGLAVRRSVSGRLRLRQWHRSAGVVSGMVLLFSAVTGILLAAPDLAAPGTASRADPRPSRSPADIDRAVRLASAQFSGARLRDIRFRSADRLDFNFFAPEHNPRAVHVVSVAAGEGRVLRKVPAAENPALWMKVLPLHAGDNFGLTGRLTVLAGALALLFLTASGPAMWWRARRSGRKAF